MAAHDVTTDVAGQVWQVLKSVGDPVAADEPILIIEAMKMEIPVVSEIAGTLNSLGVAEGDAVEEDQIVAVLETGA